ncbi:MAG: hypothetical protein U0941_02015 [Planctomycetaceae bacterium]
MSDAEYEDIDDKLEELSREISSLSEQCRYRTMLRVVHEARRLARVEQKLIPYLMAGFHLMNDSRNVLQPVPGREAAIELITLLESEDSARQFQPNLPEEKYEQTKWWMTACAYDNLAVNTAESNGYNSDGMHQCITDGIQVCRRTGKLQCIACFREYGTDVYIAADDLDMALHHARVGINNTEPGPHDRRHVGAKDSVRILVLIGQLEPAMEMLDLAWKLSEVYHSPYAGRLDTYSRAVELYHLAGCPERLEKFPKILTQEEGEEYDGPDDAVLIEPDRDEFPAHFLDRELANSVVASCKGDYEAAAALLQPWDVLLREQKSLTRWFEVRLRLVANARLTGKMSRAVALAKPLEEAAKHARDFLTLRRLERLLDEAIPATPLALAGPVTIGPYADKTSLERPVDAGESSSSEGTADGDDAEETPSTPLAETVNSFYMRMMESRGAPDVLAGILEDVIAITPDGASDPEDASRLMHIARFVGIDPDHANAIWNWSNAFVQRHPQHATILSMQAALAAHLLNLGDESLNDLITHERLEKQFRQSLDLEPNKGDNFARAGSYYLDQENYGEAERCLARGFRLMRTSGQIALKLAEVYSRTDRPRDAVAVLDMALREGCDDPDVAWEAALTAVRVEQYEAALTYLDRFDDLRPGEAWSNHYRACSLLELNRPAEAMSALDREQELNPGLTYHVEVQRASSLAGMKNVEEFRTQLEKVLAIPVSSIDYLTANGLQRLYTRLWISTSECVAFDDPAMVQLETRLLELGLAPNEIFIARRARQPEVEGDKVQFYRCIVHQPLDDRWESFPGRLAADEGWESYDIPWGVLAHDEAEAAAMVLEFQGRCYPLPAEVVEVEGDGEDYADKAGVVWQGYREGESPDDELGDDEDDDNDED